MESSNHPFKRARPGLGTLVTVAIAGLERNRAIEISEAVFAEVSRLEKIFNFFDSESELSKLNASPAFEPGPDLLYVLRLGRLLEAASAGAFTLTPRTQGDAPAFYSIEGKTVRKSQGCRFDLGGIAKGYIVDRAFEMAQALSDGAPVSVNAGGDLRSSFEGQVEIRVPTRSGEKRFAVAVDGYAVATSSTIESPVGAGRPAARYARHRINRIGSATVLARSCACADAFTKVALFGGDRALRRALQESFGVGAVFRFDGEGEAS